MTYIRRLPSFEYVSASTVKEACAVLSNNKGKVKILAGGTDLLVQMKERKVVPEYVIGLKQISGLNKIEENGKAGLRIGTLVTHHEIARSPQMQENFTCLAKACEKIGTPQVRNLGTIGGNLCNAGPSADSAPALLALGAVLTLQTGRGERQVPLEKFFTGPFSTILEEDELLTFITIPHLKGKSGSAYHYLTKRTAVDETLVGAAAALSLKAGDDVCEDVKIGLCSVAPTPIRALKAESKLKGKKLTDGLIEEASRIASGESRPRSWAEYRRDMVAVMVKRAVTEAWHRAAANKKGSGK
ncbi:MAG: xanthine dehydrogenase family protein subunit M [Dehalococcoidia bacterium]|nr:xanthine dehydrogenase family protein subunit M [Dehalococcoidia bacterium]MDZ4245752.1 xanthine dehydrogenase family protein subunit M [Dehalococcoidia bacterium]